MATPDEMTPVPEQWQIFLSLAAAGVALAFAFDCYRVVRYYWRPGALATYTGDAMFWVLLTLLVFAFLMLVNWGEVRVYVFLALGSGAGLYLLTLSRPIRNVLYACGYWLVRLLHICRRCLGRVLLVVYMPGRRLLSLLVWPLNLPRAAWQRLRNLRQPRNRPPA